MFPTKKLQYFEERSTRHIDGYFHKLRHISPPAYYRHNKLDIPLHFRIYPIAPTPPATISQNGYLFHTKQQEICRTPYHRHTTTLIRKICALTAGILAPCQERGTNLRLEVQEIGHNSARETIRYYKAH